MSFDPAQFDQVVFSGGGTRCFWHGGFLKEAGSFEEFAPVRVSGVSGGALSGSAWISGNDDRCKRVMGDIFERNESNIALGRDNLTPHQELYREAVSGILPADAIARIADGPSFQVLLGSPPSFMPNRLFAAICGAGYKIEQLIYGTPRLRFSRWVGLRGVLVDARQAARDGKLIDLVCAAATIPPVFDIPCWEGKDVVDGGMLTKAPYPEPDEGRTLVLLTKDYRNTPRDPDKIYVTPSSEVEADKIDFTKREKIEETWEQGRKDAKAFLADWSD
ncbi:patatin-like phospholipase family protein [Erythrobacter sp. JK5]|uniref:patatin-like phospholipase family protein n=1 Tax=Erythrobacter sp. JK5 TaxID=2829500 RepID=UPI001BAAEDCA|nr:patatin-like phospholipase family protein [Erythrobacter sp. JK5]QUL38954.1 patatin-like phospholipase family protein [Erythrobacter sp. JK5]